ncbi:hypothetical protein WJX64_00380 [Leifsonia sp. YIM 134122]|uniref:Uncharacterized protein n=1 Tax=Leifsonia stereocauli TaxID=3134136 RepID=A0ABU9VZK0_9MICO
MILPFVFQLWNELSVVSFFGEIPGPAEFEAQLWKLHVARALSVAGNLLILCTIVTLHRREVRRVNLYIALLVSIGFTVLWFWVNGGW